MSVLGDKIAANILAQTAKVPSIPWSGEKEKQTKKRFYHLPPLDDCMTPGMHGCHVDMACADRDTRDFSGLVLSPTESLHSPPPYPTQPGDGLTAELTEEGTIPDETFQKAMVRTEAEALAAANRIGYPVMLKASEGA